jgi:Sec-independent protein translocase protein TatA
VIFLLYVEIEVGKVTNVLLGFANHGDRPFNVQFIRGYLTSPLDASYVLYNFTGQQVNVTVEPEEVASLLYRFKTDALMDPREFGVVVDVFYLNEDRDTFATTFFNKTVQFTEPVEGIDAKNIFSYVFLVIMLGLLGFGVFKLASTSASVKKFLGSSKKSTSGATSSISTSQNVLRIGSPSKSQEIDLDYIPAAHRRLIEKKQKKEKKEKESEAKKQD